MKNMMMLAFTACAIGFAGCNKNDDNDINSPTCEVNNVGTLRVVCNLEDPYKVYVNNAYKGTVNAYNTADFNNITAGTYSTRYEQASGWILYPTEFTSSVTITQCGTTTVTLQ
jgi:hypothetical protein